MKAYAAAAVTVCLFGYTLGKSFVLISIPSYKLSVATVWMTYVQFRYNKEYITLLTPYYL